MNKWLKMIKVKAILPAAALIAAAAIGTTFAWQQWDLSVTNELKAHSTVVEIQEDFIPDPENDWTKEVEFVNVGDSSVFLRVSYTEYWERTVDGEKQALSGLDSSGNPIATKTWTQAWPEYWSDNKTATDDWVKKDDGWFYYRKVLHPGETTGDILEKVAFLTPLPDGYNRDDYNLFFKVEVVQCSDGSGTLNSDVVNKNATEKVFGRAGTVKDNGTVTWD